MINIKMRLPPFIRTYRFLVLMVIGLFTLNIVLIYHMLHPDNRRIVENFFLPMTSVDNPSDIDIAASEEGRCNVTNPQAQKTLARVQSDQCRRLITTAACSMQSNTFIPTALPTSCPRSDRENAGRYLGCFADSRNDRLLRGSAMQLPRTNSPQTCRFACLRLGFQLSGVQYQYECFCGDLIDMEGAKMISEQSCTKYRCPGDTHESCGGFDSIALYNTGLGEKFVPSVLYVAPDENRPKIRILFLLQFNGRNVRQVRRLLKLIYSPDHFYYVHVDSRQHLMYQEMKRLEELLAPIGNFRVKGDRYSTIWAGASLLQMMLSCIRDVANSDWADKWDFLVNLSESDMPVLPLSDVEAVLNKYKGHNFLRSHGYNTAKFVKKQGLEHVFVECDGRMWRIGERGPFPNGIRIDGGSDWVGLDKSFAYYAALSNETLPSALRKIFESVLLPAESFFHTLAHNSHFCDRIVNSNLKHTNWKRKQGCKCQYKAIVDWCGCSPNVFTPEDLVKLEPENAKKRGYWFARKFDSIISQTPIAQVERQALADRQDRIPDPSHPSFHRVWLDDYSMTDGANIKSFWAESVFRIWQRDAADSCKECRFDKVLSVHVYKENDLVAPRFLTKLRVLCGTASYSSIELLVERSWLTQWTLLDGRPVNGFLLQSLHVSSAFDPKEEIFRNFIGLLDVHSNPTLRLQWLPKNEPAGAVSGTVSNVSSPAVQITWLHSVKRPRTAVAEDVKPHDSIFGVQHIEMDSAAADLNLEPGVWKALVLDGDRSVAEVSFPIFPDVHNTDIYDQLTERFYRVVHACTNDTKSCGAKMSKCSLCDWSSDFADPKSDISYGYDIERRTLR